MLLTSIWTAEAIRPSRFLLLAVPDLFEGQALDNRAGGFSAMEASWGERIVRISDMLLRALAQGGDVWVLTRRRADGPNLLLARLRERAVEVGLGSRFRAAEAESLPAAGVFGDGFALTGAVAFTDTGPDFAGEGVVFELDPAAGRVSNLRTTFEGLLA
ncbi:MAG: hypothetical protein IT456_28125 [Planctomycetes bacterium]|nr:hypothetical protein [Planctomycetota bacterium]